jgi:hypothetical protein
MNRGDKEVVFLKSCLVLGDVFHTHASFLAILLLAWVENERPF